MFLTQKVKHLYKIACVKLRKLQRKRNLFKRLLIIIKINPSFHRV